MKYQTAFSDNYYFKQDPVTEFEGVSLPEERSRADKQEQKKPFFRKKKLSDGAKRWLLLHEETNWIEISLKQEHQSISKKRKEIKWITWHLPGTESPKDYCGNWIKKGCFNLDAHPKKKPYVVQTKMSCFRSGCEKCWLEKWLSREASRATRRIENFQELKLSGRKKPIHVIVSPPWKDKFRFDLLKNKCRKMLEMAHVKGGLMIYHPFDFKKSTHRWQTRPHFHIICFGWVADTNKISDEEGWVIKNKGVRKSVHSTVYYQLSHAGVSSSVHSLTWFGELSYRSKYAEKIKVKDEETHEFCEYCGFMMVLCCYIGVDRPPPDFEFIGLVDSKDWRSLESVDDAVKRKEQLRERFMKKREKFVGKHWLNVDCMTASEKADSLKVLMDLCEKKVLMECSQWFLFFFQNFI